MLNSVLEYQLPIAQAAEIMGVSEHHTKRLLAGYRKDGPAALAHGNRGRKPHNAVPETAAAAVVKLASNGYAGANHSHFTELLREREGIDLSRPTVRRILVKAGIGSPRSRRFQQDRFRRRRMPREGMLLQIDGSHHPWLEDRGPKLTLLIAVDDATGTGAGPPGSRPLRSRGAHANRQHQARIGCRTGTPGRAGQERRRRITTAAIMALSGPGGGTSGLEHMTGVLGPARPKRQVNLTTTHLATFQL